MGLPFDCHKDRSFRMIARYISLLRLGTIHPQLLTLAWKLKREKKTYLTYSTLLSLVKNFLLVNTRQSVPLHVAEFGVGRGGSAMILGWMVGRYGGRLRLYDVFGRIPSPTDINGVGAEARYQVILNQESKEYYGNILNLLELIKIELSSVCDLSQVDFVQGRYEETIKHHVEKRPYDLVHIDCDWYESSKEVLSYLKTNLSQGAIIQVDDYSNWQGSNIAVNEAEWLHPFKRKLVDGALVIDTGELN